MLVGVIGKYEYRPYVRRVGNYQQIEYQCDEVGLCDKQGWVPLGPKLNVH